MKSSNSHTLTMPIVSCYNFSHSESEGLKESFLEESRGPRTVRESVRE